MKRHLKTLTLLIALLIGNVSIGYTQDYSKGLKAYENGDYAEALRQWKLLAEQGDAFAQHTIGLMYHFGEGGVTQDYKTAVKWYRAAAEQGLAEAQYNLGVVYENGDGVMQDFALAHMWFNIAASNGIQMSKKNRDLVAEKMISADIAKAQQMARECVEKNYKSCWIPPSPSPLQ